jgi:hypothetical protein
VPSAFRARWEHSTLVRCAASQKRAAPVHLEEELSQRLRRQCPRLAGPFGVGLAQEDQPGSKVDTGDAAAPAADFAALLRGHGSTVVMGCSLGQQISSRTAQY